MSESQSATSGLTRRDLLKRGAAIGGALWAVPVVQMIGMNPAMAAVPSDVCVCVKLTNCSNGANWQELGNPNATGNCTSQVGLPSQDCDPKYNAGQDSDFRVDNCLPLVGGDDVCIEFVGNDATIYYPKRCSLTHLYEKAGSGEGSCVDHTPGAPDPIGQPLVWQDLGTHWCYTFTINQAATGGCSHIEVCIQC